MRGTMLTARVEVRLKRGVADPEGENTRKALRLLGFEEVAHVRSARVFEIDLELEEAARAREVAEEVARRLLANPVIHDADVEILEAGVARSPSEG